MLFTNHFPKIFLKILKKSQQPCCESLQQKQKMAPTAVFVLVTGRHTQSSLTSADVCFLKFWHMQLLWSCLQIVDLSIPTGQPRCGESCKRCFPHPAAPSKNMASVGAALISSGRRARLQVQLEEAERKLRNYVDD